MGLNFSKTAAAQQPAAVYVKNEIVEIPAKANMILQNTEALPGVRKTP